MYLYSPNTLQMHISQLVLIIINVIHVHVHVGVANIPVVLKNYTCTCICNWRDCFDRVCLNVWEVGWKADFTFLTVKIKLLAIPLSKNKRYESLYSESLEWHVQCTV